MIYETHESKLTLGANEDRQYQRLCSALGLAHLLTDARFAETEERASQKELAASVVSG
ncbi:MAG: CoA transferase [Betaproteobacteria bacterium]|nr:CoA transferase [Betaproteobacteria bacterium]